MTRGVKPLAAIREAKKFAEKMGYRWQENSENPEIGWWGPDGYYNKYAP